MISRPSLRWVVPSIATYTPRNQAHLVHSLVLSVNNHTPLRRAERDMPDHSAEAGPRKLAHCEIGVVHEADYCFHESLADTPMKGVRYLL